MASLQYSIDNICADFTVDSLSSLVRAQLNAGRSALGEVAQAIMEADRSLDIKSAENLAKAAVEALSQSAGASSP